MTVEESPKGTRTLEPILSERLTSFAKESIVKKRVPFGELVSFLRKEITDKLTHGAERSAAGRFAYSDSSDSGVTARRIR